MNPETLMNRKKDAVIDTTIEAPSKKTGGPWISGARWDLAWLVGSAAVVPVLLLLVWGGVSSDLLNLAVTLLVGGPHVFATSLTTFLDPRYRRRHPWALLAIGAGVPALVVFMTIQHFQVLMSIFIFSASFHVLQQNAYLADAYRNRGVRRDPAWSRVLDYAVLFLSFYPIASYKLVGDDFLLGSIRIIIPDFARTPWTVAAVSVAFVVAASLWLLKTAAEWRCGILNRPKTLLIGLTSTIAFLVPAAASGPRLELAFQTVNVWHSIQYLALVWLVLKVRKDQGRSVSPLLDRISGSGKPAWRFYGLCIVYTSLLLGVIALLRVTDPLRLSAWQYYYMCVLSVLFIHYALDGYFFLVSRNPSADPERAPYALFRKPVEETLPPRSALLKGGVDLSRALPGIRQELP